MYRFIGMVYLRYNYGMVMPLLVRSNGKTLDYRALHGRALLPVITYKSRLYTNDIVSVKLNSWFSQYATGKVRIYQ